MAYDFQSTERNCGPWFRLSLDYKLGCGEGINMGQHDVETLRENFRVTCMFLATGARVSFVAAQRKKAGRQRKQRLLLMLFLVNFEGLHGLYMLLSLEATLLPTRRILNRGGYQEFTTCQAV